MSRRRYRWGSSQSLSEIRNSFLLPGEDRNLINSGAVYVDNRWLTAIQASLVRRFGEGFTSQAVLIEPRTTAKVGVILSSPRRCAASHQQSMGDEVSIKRQRP